MISIGGIYFIISRTLGAEFGASVGIVFAFANAVSASMNTIGFCDSLNDLLRENNLKIIDNGVNDVRIVGIIALIVMILICAIGMEWESKVFVLFIYFIYDIKEINKYRNFTGFELSFLMKIINIDIRNYFLI